MKEEWSSVCMVCGVQSVMMVGVLVMQELCAGNWDSQKKVNSKIINGNITAYSMLHEHRYHNIRC